MEHFKKRLIHQHQKPLVDKMSSKPLREDADDDASSNSSSSSGSNSIMQSDAKKDGNSTHQLKIARKRAVCRSKFRHNSLKIFKLGSSIPTSLCKSKEPYNVSAEKNLQHCCEDPLANKNKKEEKSIQKESITESIINSIEGNNKKDNFQRSISANLDYSNTFIGKHNLPAIISEIPTKRRNSLSRSSEDEQKIIYTTISKELEQTKPNLINYRRKTVTGTETPKEEVLKNDQIRYKPHEKIERISPDSTFTETQYSLLKHLHNNTPPIFTSNYNKVSPVPLPLNITLPHNTSITPIVSTKERTPEPSFISHNYHYSPVQKEVIQKNNNNMDNPINLSVKQYKENETYNHLPCSHLIPNYQLPPQISENKEPFPEIQYQISRLQNKPFDVYKSMEESVLRSAAQTAYSVMVAPFSVENLIILNYSYKRLVNVKYSKNIFKDPIRNLSDEIVVYVNAKLFDSTSPICRSYTQQIMELDLEPHTALLKDVIHLLRKKCYDPEWMRHFFIILSRNERKNPVIKELPYYPINWPQPTMIPTYFPPLKIAPMRKTNKPRGPQVKKRSYSKMGLKTDSYPSDSRCIPPEGLCTGEKNLQIDNKKDSEVLLKIDKENDTVSVIVKDKSMEVTKGNKEVGININEKNNMEKTNKYGSKNILLDDLHLFEEFLKQEDKNIYNRILNKILHVKETVKEVITIDDEEDTFTSNNKLKEILLKPQQLPLVPSSNTNNVKESTDVVIIDDDTEDKIIQKNNSDFNQNYITMEKLKKNEHTRGISVKNDIENNTKITLNQYPLEETKRTDLKLEIKNPIPESPEIFTPPSSTGRSSLSHCRNPENLSPIVLHSPILSPLTPCSSLGLLSTKPEVNSNWKSWLSEERKKGFLDAKQPTHRRQSIETISSVGSDYSPNLDYDDNNVKIRIDSKWYRVKKTVMEAIPRGKLYYVREKNYLFRYFDENQLAQFIQNMNISLVSPAACDFLKQIKDRVDALSDDIFITPYDIPENNEVIQLAAEISFTKDDFISIPELYVEEVEKVERFVPNDFLGFYKYVTGYQIVNNHHPISFQTFLTLHNTNRIKIFYKKYLLSILENKYM